MQTVERMYIKGSLEISLFDEYGNLKEFHEVDNLLTQVGDQYYGERAAGIASPPGSVTGMQLGTGTTAPAKTSTGSALITLIASSLVAVGTPVSSLNGSARRIAYTTTWNPGVATNTAIAEVVLVNQSVGTQTAAPSSATIARALVSPTINKLAADTLTVNWYHDILGA